MYVFINKRQRHHHNKGHRPRHMCPKTNGKITGSVACWWVHSLFDFAFEMKMWNLYPAGLSMNRITQIRIFAVIVLINIMVEKAQKRKLWLILSLLFDWESFVKVSVPNEGVLVLIRIIFEIICLYSNAGNFKDRTMSRKKGWVRFKLTVLTIWASHTQTVLFYCWIHAVWQMAYFFPWHPLAIAYVQWHDKEHDSFLSPF